MRWSAVALPLALLAALATSRLQHERDVVGMYAANLVVNSFLILTLMAVAASPLGGGADAGTLALAGGGVAVGVGFAMP